jgi:hypothetical protein
MRLATTAFSFTNEWLARRLTLEQLLQRVAELRLGPGIEVIGFQTWRTYPRLAADERLSFRRLVDGLGLLPAALGGYADLLRRPGRPMSVAEAVECLEPQIAVAAELGFPLLCLHVGIPVAVLDRLAPVAERAGVTLATEIQAGQTPDDPSITAVLECRERLGSPNIALALDFSIAMTDVPTCFVEAVCGAGMRRDQLDEIVARWVQRASTHELLAALSETEAPAAAVREARSGFVRFGRQDPQAWLPFVSQIAHAHAKFWELDESGDDPTVRTRELIEVLRAGGYGGFVAGEWGGNAWVDVDDVDAFEVVRAHHELCRGLVSRPAVGAPV